MLAILLTLALHWPWWVLLGVTITFTLCPSCCGCPDVDELDIVITGESCILTCEPTTEQPGFWFTGDVNISGGYTLPAVIPSNWVLTIPNGFSYDQYITDDCSDEPAPDSALITIQVICHPEGNDDGKHLGLFINFTRGPGAFTVYLWADLNTNPDDWFDFDEEVEITLPCGSFTVLVPTP